MVYGILFSANRWPSTIYRNILYLKLDSKEINTLFHSFFEVINYNNFNLMNSKKWIDHLMAPAGISINGPNSWDIKVLNEELYDRVITEKSLGLGEAYVDGWWECDNLDQFFYRLLVNHIDKQVNFSLSILFDIIRAKALNLQSPKRSFEIGEKHYDIGNDLFIHMLGKTMAYSCAYWKEVTDLDLAQEAKFDLICRKLNFQSGQKILDIGCGWGSFGTYATKEYGVEVTGVTVSENQAAYAKEHYKDLPMEIRLEDYRNLNEKFDYIVSIGMIEHVGSKNYRTYMEVARRCLKEEGLFLLHTIGGLKDEDTTDPWVNRYIFPNGVIPSLGKIAKSIEDLFIIEDLHNFGADYDRTLMCWYENFERNWPKLKDRYSNRFYRMWRYYLLSCAGAFRARSLQLWQIVLSPNGVPGGYGSIR
jgi:cyclopropane-fatty-acyl-phospholipid synthase